MTRDLTPLHDAPAARRRRSGEHRWVAAALVDVGVGSHSPRADHAARTGRHVVRAGTRVEVLEVYCAWCRVGYGSASASRPCPGVTLSAAGFVRAAGAARSA